MSPISVYYALDCGSKNGLLMKANDSDLRVIHWEFDGIRYESVTGVDLILDPRLGKDAISKNLEMLRLKWLYRLIDKKENVILDFVAEDDFKLTTPKLIKEPELKKIVWQSFWRFNTEFAFRMKPYGEHTIFYNLPEDTIPKILELIKS